MARYGCLALAIIVATALLFFIVYLWSGWLNRPVGHHPPVAANGVAVPRVPGLVAWDGEAAVGWVRSG